MPRQCNSNGLRLQTSLSAPFERKGVFRAVTNQTVHDDPSKLGAASSIASGRQLRAARTLAGLTQSELSTEAGFNPRACRYWESRGDYQPTSTPQSLAIIEQVLLRHGVEVFTSPTPGCRLASTK
jgi:DNA-binding transcriptional regulator YiaG